MVFEFKLPDIGEGLTEAEIVEWLVKEGDKVEEHQAIAKVETAKAVAEIPSPKSGVILKIHHKAGDTVKVGETLVTIGEMGEIVAKPEKFGVVGELPVSEKVWAPPKAGTKVSAQEVLAIPAVRRLARELNVDLGTVRGTGDSGRITEEDIRNVAKPQQTVMKIRKYDFYGYLDRVPLRGVRKATAQHMAKAWQVPHVSHMDEADVTELWNYREKEKKAAAEKGVHLTFLPFIIKAVAAALKQHPYFNASLDEETQEIIMKKYYNFGIAVDTPDGLIVPVVKGAEQKSVLELAKEIEDKADKAIKRTLDLAELKGTSFTITNIGVLGGYFATPIVNTPDVAILATGKIKDRAVVDKNGKVVARKILPLTISFDHRVQDGANAARFMNTLISYLEDIKFLTG